MSLVEYRKLIRGLLIIETVLLIMGAILVTNMHPLWMQHSIVLLFVITVVTALVYYFGVARVRY